MGGRQSSDGGLATLSELQTLKNRALVVWRVSQSCPWGKSVPCPLNAVDAIGGIRRTPGLDSAPASEARVRCHNEACLYVHVLEQQRVVLQKTNSRPLKNGGQGVTGLFSDPLFIMDI